ncbi:MAG: hypothetical protein LBJ61_04880 [Deltaproteobacteria bacterium]|jgi:hypothetical protein|nr:hypothetical protein [Deltaproteobacteria bacterium]
MKIITFKPPVTKLDGQGGKTTRQGESLDFESLVTKRLNPPAGAKPESNPLAVVDKITLENRLASQGAAVEDVGMAGALLNTLVGQITASRSETLQSVHNLEGILYYYQL